MTNKDARAEIEQDGSWERRGYSFVEVMRHEGRDLAILENGHGQIAVSMSLEGPADYAYYSAVYRCDGVYVCSDYALGSEEVEHIYQWTQLLAV